MRRTPDPAVTIHALQLALDRAQGRIRELETTSATMAARMGAATERADMAEMRLATPAAATSGPPEWPLRVSTAAG